MIAQPTEELVERTAEFGRLDGALAELEQIVEIAAHEPGRRFEMRVVEGPLPVHGDLTFSPADGGGTRLHVHAYGQANGAMRLLQPLLTVGLKREFAASTSG